MSDIDSKVDFVFMASAGVMLDPKFVTGKRSTRVQLSCDIADREDGLLHLKLLSWSCHHNLILVEHVLEYYRLQHVCSERIVRMLNTRERRL